MRWHSARREPPTLNWFTSPPNIWFSFAPSIHSVANLASPYLEQAPCQPPKLCELFSRGAGLRGGSLFGLPIQNVRKIAHKIVHNIVNNSDID